MRRVFGITMHAPIGKKRGKMCYNQEKGCLNGTIELLGGKDDFSGHISESGEIDFSGTITSKFSSFAYTAKGRVDLPLIDFKITGGRYSFRVTGEEIISPEEKRRVLNELY